MFNDNFFNDFFDNVWNNFNRPVKDMSPYKAYFIDGKGIMIICNTLGVAKEDLKVVLEQEKGAGYPVLKITGETEIPSIKVKNTVNLGIKLKIDKPIKSIDYKVKDGLTTIYITTEEPEKKTIEAKIADDDTSLDW